MSFLKYRVGVGQDSHRFLPPESTKLCVIGGLTFPDTPGLSAETDGDVVYHAICNAITSLTGVPILHGIALELCHKDGITDSEVFLIKALEILEPQKIQHIAFTIEAKRPNIEARGLEMRQKIATVMKLEISQVGLTVNTGSGLTDVSCGDGVHCLCLLTTYE